MRTLPKAMLIVALMIAAAASALAISMPEDSVSEAAPTAGSGIDGGIKWTMTADGALSIEPNAESENPGHMESYGSTGATWASGATSIVVAKGVKDIGVNAFRNLNTLTSVTFQTTEADGTTIGSGAFSNISGPGIVSIDLGNVVSLGNSAFDRSGPMDIKMDHVATIGYYCFRETDIRSISAVSLKDGGGTMEFSNAKLPETVEFPSLTGTVMFGGTTGLRHIILPSLITVHQGQFGNSSVEVVDIPKAIYVNIMGFYNCSSLHSVYSPNLKQISNFAFQNCVSLAHLEIGEMDFISGSGFSGSGLVFKLAGETIPINHNDDETERALSNKVFHHFADSGDKVLEGSYKVSVKTAKGFAGGDQYACGKILGSSGTDPVSLTVDTAEHYYLPEGYSIPSINGVSVSRISDTRIAISGNPTANTVFELLPAEPILYPVTFSASVPGASVSAMVAGQPIKSGDGALYGSIVLFSYSASSPDMKPAGDGWTHFEGKVWQISKTVGGDLDLQVSAEDYYIKLTVGTGLYGTAKDSTEVYESGNTYVLNSPKELQFAYTAGAGHGDYSVVTWFINGKSYTNQAVLSYHVDSSTVITFLESNDGSVPEEVKYTTDDGIEIKTEYEQSGGKTVVSNTTHIVIPTTTGSITGEETVEYILERIEEIKASGGKPILDITSVSDHVDIAVEIIQALAGAGGEINMVLDGGIEIHVPPKAAKDINTQASGRSPVTFTGRFESQAEYSTEVYIGIAFNGEESKTPLKNPVKAVVPLDNHRNKVTGYSSDSAGAASGTAISVAYSSGKASFDVSRSGYDTIVYEPEKAPVEEDDDDYPFIRHYQTQSSGHDRMTLFAAIAAAAVAAVAGAVAIMAFGFKKP